MPQPKKQKDITKAIPKKAANSKAPAKLRKAAIPRTDSITTNKVKRAELDADSDYKALIAPEGGAPTLAPISNITTCKWIYDDTTDSLIEKDIQFIPSFFKIFDEVLVNAADNKQKLVEIHKEEKVYVSEIIFGHLLTSSNYDDKEKKTVGGLNGSGSKLCNIFSTEFIVEMASKESGKNKFQINHLNTDIVGLLKRKLKLNNFKEYIQMYLKNAPRPNGEDLTKRFVFEWVSERWEVGFIPSSLGQLQQFQVGVLNSWIINMLIALLQAKNNIAMVESLDSTKSGCILGIPKQEDANKACTKVVWDYYGVLHLHGKLLNMRDAIPAQVKGNKELINICKVMGLNS
ncbi:DNA topoisomerase 2 [Massospora cicadina]|nr:DNA topoisomerase 2 [Massospora cicadina]